MTLTATPTRVREANVAALIHLSFWRSCLERGAAPTVVAAMIEAAADFEPLLGVPMEQCNGCETWVDDSARDEHGQLWCSDGCRDFASEVSDELRQRLGYEAGLDVRSTRPADIPFGGPR